ncbi:exopolysaccharide biosynthesis polyprenyl glycosylphosphotransferase [Puniceicoccus vermicola]|uniref:Exopolysaccharide biosynthesis polyprenyl glycosylphosphotransferase n=1 Tax=Puniceicoccus vermicola TaxID=388746 RepID=A0A7X1AY66_9BACT|nr:exopolysaccharide biosynthesis polyprenyl glycosylphosphotransferase [Puniceicoccus vermicola]MBC2601108.1 exopolysaccharide biosynthesis polyprenyl glycosylphosphotransferase [Puniceicoccus vermicola]
MKTGEKSARVQSRTDWYFGGRSWLVVDFFAGVFAILLAYFLNPDLTIGWQPSFAGQPAGYPAAIGFGVLLALVADIAGLHDPLRQQRFWPVTIRIIFSLVITFLLAVVILYGLALQQLGRTVSIQSMIAAGLMMSGFRGMLFRIQGRTRRRILLLLNRGQREDLRDRIEKSGLPFRVADLPDSYDTTIENTRLMEVCHKLKIDEVVVPEESGSPESPPVWMDCLESGIQVTHARAFVERYFYRVDCSDVRPNWFLELDLRLTHPVYHRWKRFSDILLASIGLLVAAPFLLFFLGVIWAESGRPLFFKQQRVGLRSKPFTILKLRTMSVLREEETRDADRLNDSRVTRIGYILRRTRLDEVPQFWNIIRGDMSFIGPRPEWIDIAEDLGERIPYYPYRTLVKPGLTGWAQINFGYAANDEEVREKLGFDFYYLKNASVMLDLQILIRTVGSIMRGSR